MTGDRLHAVIRVACIVWSVAACASSAAPPQRPPPVVASRSPAPVHVATADRAEDITNSRQDRTRCASIAATDVARREQACTNGDKRGCFDAAELYACGRYAPLDTRKAAALYDRACQLGERYGCFDAAALLTDFPDASADELARAAALFRGSCDQAI